MLSICFIYIQSNGIFIVFLWLGEMHKYIKNYNRYYIKWNNLMTSSHFWSSYNEYVYNNDSSKAVIRFWNTSRLFLHLHASVRMRVLQNELVCIMTTIFPASRCLVLTIGVLLNQVTRLHLHASVWMLASGYPNACVHQASKRPRCMPIVKTSLPMHGS